jgi:23S rRNA pseudouridine1911/1915/1917 synthase
MPSKFIELTIKEKCSADLPVREYHKAPRSQIRALFDNGCVRINGEICKNPGTKVLPSDVLTLTLEEGKRYKEKKKLPPTKDFSIVYEDGYLIVVDKAPGVLTVPTESGAGLGISLLDQLAESISSARSLEVIHRLDKETSGLLVFAKSQGITRKLKEQFEKRKPERIYFAIVKGVLAKKEGTFESYLSTDKDLNQYSVEEKDKDKGKYACTHYWVEKVGKGATLVRVQLDTGRRNQIRVHFSEAGHPVIGDQRYKVTIAKHPNWKHKSLALHASTLSFTHPATNKVLSFTSPMPERMKKFLKDLEA